MRTAQTPLKPLNSQTFCLRVLILLPSTVFLYSSGYHTHHFLHLDTLLGAKFFQRWRGFLRCPAHNTYIYIRDKKINIYIYMGEWVWFFLKKRKKVLVPPKSDRYLGME